MKTVNDVCNILLKDYADFDIALIARVRKSTKEIYEFCVADNPIRDMNNMIVMSNGISWIHGHYFDDIEDAMAYVRKTILDNY